MVSSLNSLSVNSAKFSLLINCRHNLHQNVSLYGSRRVFTAQSYSSVSCSSSLKVVSSSQGDVNKRSSLESLFCYDKSIPEEIIEKPVGLSFAEKDIGDKPRCETCEAKGAVLCVTCAGSGLYVDSILESQGIIVKVRCLGCGGTGNIMCLQCHGRGHR